MRELTESPLDTAMSVFLTERSGLGQGRRERFTELVRSLLGAMRDGHSCIEVDEKDQAVLTASRTVSAEGLTPLILSGRRLYLHRSYTYEVRLAENLRALAAESLTVDGLDELLDHCFPVTTAPPDWQREAARLALSNRLSIIAGGPGTGKTTTVVKIVGLLLSHYGIGLKIALTAPTGKAAVRLQEALQEHLPVLPLSPELKAAFPNNARTLHRLLGVRRFSGNFIHTKDNPLPWEVVLVDEASMVDLALMCKLVAALRPGSRLILLGDKDQLASVEAGAVLADICGSEVACSPVFAAQLERVTGESIPAAPAGPALRDSIVHLRRSYRFGRDTGIGRLAELVRAGEGEAALALLQSGECADLAWRTLESPESLARAAGAELAVRFSAYLTEVQSRQPLEDALAAFNAFRVLCAHRTGPSGAQTLNRLIERGLRTRRLADTRRDWYPGRPIMVARNDYNLRLYNGDVGIVVRDAEGDSVAFAQPDHGVRRLAPSRLPEHETVYAMTVHKAQGSEFDAVLLVLPGEVSRALSRELIYTAITRARSRIEIWGTPAVFLAGVTRRLQRSSGLRDRLWGTED